MIIIMRHLKQVLLVSFMNLMSIIGQAANIEVGIGGYSVGYFPFDLDYKYSLCQMLYTPAEIGQSGRITSIAYYVSKASSFTNSSLKIYLGHKSGTFTGINQFLKSSDLTLVYSGSPTLGKTTGWETLTFNRNDFIYNGNDNLVVVVSRAGNRGSASYSCGTVYSDILHGNSYEYNLYRKHQTTSSIADITNTSAYSRSVYRPEIRLEIESEFVANTSEGFEMTFTTINTINKTCQVGGNDNPSISTSIEGCISVPERVNDFSVIGIGAWAFKGCSELTNIIIPSSVNKIGNAAFYGCSSLTSVSIPNSVTDIGYSAFMDCNSLISVAIPNSVTTIGSSAFSGCI